MPGIRFTRISVATERFSSGIARPDHRISPSQPNTSFQEFFSIRNFRRESSLRLREVFILIFWDLGDLEILGRAGGGMGGDCLVSSGGGEIVRDLGEGESQGVKEEFIYRRED